MQIAVYGTLKRGYGNNRILTEGTGVFIEERILPGFKLYNAGFPVAMDDNDSSILVEIWDIGDPTTNDDAFRTLSRLDRLEGEGSMYHRVYVQNDVQMYVGRSDFWSFERMEEESRNEDGVYVWHRDYR